MALTDTRLRTLKPEKGKDERLVADGNGLYMRVRSVRGEFTRTWQFRCKEKGKPSITTLGTYPELSIKEARLKAAELATKRKMRNETVEEVATQWHLGSFYSGLPITSGTFVRPVRSRRSRTTWQPPASSGRRWDSSPLYNKLQHSAR